MNSLNFSQQLSNLLCTFIFLSLSTLSAFAQDMPGMKMDAHSEKTGDLKDMKMEEMLPMPFFTHMGIPYNVGTYGLRVAE